MRERGYKGEVSRLNWSYSFNPAIDQTVRAIGKLGARHLAGCIQDYMDHYPGRDVNIVGLSAGSGVAIWALEDLNPQYQVNNVVLLGSSLSSDYDVGDALQHVKGKIYVYYSPNDAMLAGPMKVFGTIDGKLLAEGVGQVGLHPPRGAERVVNIAWRPEFEQYGYSGGHTDATNPVFVKQYVAEHLLSPKTGGSPGTTTARLVATAPRRANPD
jgi:pimeloyl-ACP methyl ester carboxylesterase